MTSLLIRTLEPRSNIYLKMLNLRPTDSVLDLGCEEGLLVHRIKSHCTKITGIDISEKALKRASRINPDCEFYLKDIIKTGLPKMSFDVVYGFEVLQYIQQKQPVFEEMFKLARRSVVFSIPNYDCLWAQITKARQALFGVRDYPDSPVKQWLKINQLFIHSEIEYNYHSLASRVQEGIPGLLKYYLRRLLRHRLFIITRIDLNGEQST